MKTGLLCVIAAAALLLVSAETQPEPKLASGSVTLVPAEERLPPTQDQLITTANVPPNAASAPGNTAVVPPSVIRRAESPAPNALPGEEFSPFQAPLVSNLAPGKWYVQLGVYYHPDDVEDEINRIGTAYPVAIQNIGTDTNPLFRVLLGPLNQGESGAMLQRFKSIGYINAFVRNNELSR